MRDLLQAVWGDPRPTNVPVRVWRDWVLVVALVTGGVIEGLVRADLPQPAIVPVIVAVGLVPTLLWRRTHPLLMVAIAFPACAAGEVVVGADLGMSSLGFLLLLAYALYRWGSGREAVVGTGIIVGKIWLSALLGYLTSGNALAGTLVVSTAATAGFAVRNWNRARRRELEQIKLLERERLARDLHDTVAHHVSAIAVRAQAGLATLDAQPDAAADALRIIEAEASNALAEMRTLVWALRRDEEPAAREPTPHIADLERFAVHVRPGPEVDVELIGDIDAVPPSVGLAVYRLAQESITNARRHARHATRIQVRVAADATAVHLRVSDDGDGTALRSGGSGYGLTGMIERAGLLGGSVEAGPNPDRGWTVTAVLPRTVPA